MVLDRAIFNIEEPVIICSDLHIKDMEEPRTKLFLSLLETIDPTKVKYIILNGDIFDFYFGPKDFFHKKFEPIISSLENLSRQGVQIYFVEGNHEFSMNKVRWQGIHIVDNQTLLLEVEPDVYLAFCHGDKLMAPWHYFVYRWITRTRIFAWIAALIPSSFLDKFALSISSASRERSYQKKVFHRTVLDQAMKWLDAQPVEKTKTLHGIFGHFHLPYHHSSKDEVNRSVLCVKSWDEPNLLLFNGKDFNRVYFQPRKE